MVNLTFTVYRKQTHTDRYLYFRSHHQIHVKRGRVRCLYDRARCIVQQRWNLREEENHLMNGYPRSFILFASAAKPPGRRRGYPLSYVAGVSEQIRMGV